LYFAGLLGVPATFIGITVTAVGSSLPELTVAISAVRKNLESLAIGNVIGANISNIFLILGVSSIINPVSVLRSTLILTSPFMILISVILLIFIESSWEIRRKEGIALFFAYTIFVFLVFYMY